MNEIIDVLKQVLHLQINAVDYFTEGFNVVRKTCVYVNRSCNGCGEQMDLLTPYILNTIIIIFYLKN